MVYRSPRGPVASPRGDAIDRDLAAVRSPGYKNGPSRPKTPVVRRIRSVSTPDVAVRPIRPAEVVQARLFEDILRAEIAEMMKLPPGAREEQRNRIEEVDRLIKALRDRFPRGRKVATPGRGLRPPADRGPRALLN